MGLAKISIGDKFPTKINVIIETVKGSKAKYELDKSGFLFLDKINKNGLVFPADYGFVPQTSWDDGDALDMFLLTGINNPPLTVVKSRPIGLLRMCDQGISDDKLIVVPLNDPEYKDVKDLKDLPASVIEKIKQFILNYKGEAVEIHGFYGFEKALKALKHGNKLYIMRQTA